MFEEWMTDLGWKPGFSGYPLSLVSIKLGEGNFRESGAFIYTFSRGPSSLIRKRSAARVFAQTTSMSIQFSYCSALTEAGNSPPSLIILMSTLSYINSL